jgi:peptidoglycan/xylan/chitin deacetylase (PgdA/CDA1 family)
MGAAQGVSRVSAPRRLLRAAQAFLPAGRRGVTVLAYHLVGAGTDSPVDLPRGVFRAQMEELRAGARAVPLAAAVAWLKSLRSPQSPAGPRDETASPAGEIAPAGDDRRPVVAVTFDDAYENFYAHAWPVLRELAIPATLFVPVGFVAGETAAPIRGTGGLPPASWKQLREMADEELLTVGSHSWSHPDLRRLPAAAVREELARSRRELEHRLGRPVTAFCYPRGLWSRRLEPLVGETYALAAVGGGRRVTAANLRPLRLGRVPLRRDMPVPLAPILRASLWLEEWLADRLRRAGWAPPSAAAADAAAPEVRP